MPMRLVASDPLPVARDRLLVVTSRLLLATWIPVMLLSAISVWDRPAVRTVVLLTMATVVAASLVIWRPSREYAWLQASLFLALMAFGIPAAGGVSGITPGGTATLTVLVAWATLFFGVRGLWGMLLVSAIVLSYTAWQFTTGRALAPPSPDLQSAGYWWRNILSLLSTFVLGGLVVRAAISAYNDALAAERVAQRRAAQEEAAREAAEAESMVLQRRESAASLAAGLAHDIANVLQVSSMQAESLLEDVTEPSQRETIRQILSADERVRRMVRELLAIGRESPGKDDDFDGRERLSRLESMLASALPVTVRPTFSVSGAPRLRGDARRFEQVVLNLVFNARDAMPGGGTIAIVLRGVDDRMAQLTVSDSGEGIAPAVREHIFEPFFTTKSSADGSGLGLSMVARIVEEIGGHIDVHSTVGVGSTFTISWPLHAAPRDAARNVD